MNKVALICGNAPSLSTLEYATIPANADVFRCNQFYFEEIYYTGRQIEYAFLNVDVIRYQLPTFEKLISKNEYEIKNIFYNMAPERLFYSFLQNKNPHEHITPSLKILDEMQDFCMYFSYLNAKYGKRITSTLNMLMTAIALGYDEIYLGGIDFYNGGHNYAFNNCKFNVAKILPQNSFDINFKDPSHDAWIDLECLRWACNYFNSPFLGQFSTPMQKLQLKKSDKIGKIFATSKNSPLANFLPINEIQETNILQSNKHILENKKTGYIDDFYIPHKSRDEYRIFLENEIANLSKEIEHASFHIFKNDKPFRQYMINFIKELRIFRNKNKRLSSLKKRYELYTNENCPPPPPISPMA